MTGAPAATAGSEVKLGLPSGQPFLIVPATFADDHDADENPLQR